MLPTTPATRRSPGPARSPLLALLVAGLAGSGLVPWAAAAEPDLDFELYDLSDTLVQTERIRTRGGAQFLVVDFFQESCEPCKKALASWRQVFSACEARGLRLVVVSIPADGPRDAAERAVKDWFRAHPQPFPVLFDRYRKVGRLYGVVTDDRIRVPQVFLLDRAGKQVLHSERTATVIEEIRRRLGSCAGAPP